MSDQSTGSTKSDRGSDRLVFGIVLAVVTFWLFAQTANIASTDLMQNLIFGLIWHLKAPFC